MIAATRSTAGAGNSHRAWRCAQRPSRREEIGTRLALALRPVEHVLELLLRLRQDLRGRRALYGLLDRHPDDVAVLGDRDDLGQPLPADLERGLTGPVPVRGHLGLGLDLGVVPGGGAAPPDPGPEVA